MIDRVSDMEVKPFIKMLESFKGDQTSWLISLATIVSQRPVQSWNDLDIKTFSSRQINSH